MFLDLLGAGERMLGIYKNNTAECNDINNALISLGYSLQGMILFENMRLTDYIQPLVTMKLDWYRFLWWWRGCIMVICNG